MTRDLDTTLLQFDHVACPSFNSSCSHRDIVRTRSPSPKIIGYTTCRHLDSRIARVNLAIILGEDVRNKQIATHAGYVEVCQARSEDLVVACVAAVQRVTKGNGSGRNELVSGAGHKSIGARVLGVCCTEAGEGLGVGYYYRRGLFGKQCKQC